MHLCCLFNFTHPKYYPDRQSFRLEPRGKNIKDDVTLNSLGLTKKGKVYFKDLGTQIGWTTNSYYYWGFTAFVAYFVNHPLYTPPAFHVLQIYGGLALFLFSEVGNLSIHYALRNLRPPATLFTVAGFYQMTVSTA